MFRWPPLPQQPLVLTFLVPGLGARGRTPEPLGRASPSHCPGTPGHASEAVHVVAAVLRAVRSREGGRARAALLGSSATSWENAQVHAEARKVRCHQVNSEEMRLGPACCPNGWPRQCCYNEPESCGSHRGVASAKGLPAVSFHGRRQRAEERGKEPKPSRSQDPPSPLRGDSLTPGSPVPAGPRSLI